MKLATIILGALVTVLLIGTTVAASHTTINGYHWSATINFGTSPEAALAEATLPKGMLAPAVAKKVAATNPLPQRKPQAPAIDGSVLP